MKCAADKIVFITIIQKITRDLLERKPVKMFIRIERANDVIALELDCA